MRDRWYKIVILTPAYPSQNVGSIVNEYSLKVIVEEFERGYKIVQEMKNGISVYIYICYYYIQNWDKLIEPTDFFSKYNDYLAITITAESEENMLKWLGYCESKFQKLVRLLGESNLFEKIHLHPIEYNNPTIESDFNAVYYIGVKSKSGRQNVDISHSLNKFYSFISKYSKTGYKSQTYDMKIQIKYMPTYPSNIRNSNNPTITTTTTTITPLKRKAPNYDEINKKIKNE